MIEAFVANTTNGQRVVIALEEFGLDHQLRYVDLWSGAHKKPDFLSSSAEPRPAIDRTNSKHDDNIRGGLNEQH